MRRLLLLVCLLLSGCSGNPCEKATADGIYTEDGVRIDVSLWCDR